MLTAKQIKVDIVAHGACPEGVAWAAGLDSDAAWSTNDPAGAQFLLWWAVKNAGAPGWKSMDEIRSVMDDLKCIAYDYLGATCEHIKVRTTEAPTELFALLVREVTWQDPKALGTFLSRILPVIEVRLRPIL